MLNTVSIWPENKGDIMATLDEMLAKCSPESLARIEEKTEKLRREVLLHQLREELAMS